MTSQNEGTIQRPTKEVPVFSSWFEPRVRVESDLASQIAGLCVVAPDE